MKRRMPPARRWDRSKPLPASIQLSPGRVVLITASELDNLPMWNRRARAWRRAGPMILPANNPRLEDAAQRIKVTMSRLGRPVIVTEVH